MRRLITGAISAGLAACLPILTGWVELRPAAADPTCVNGWVRANGSTTWVHPIPGACVPTPFPWTLHDEVGDTIVLNSVPECQSGCGGGVVIDLSAP
jgi:hypothetical protein